MQVNYRADSLSDMNEYSNFNIFDVK